MTLKALREKRARLLREAECLRQADGTFADDEARAAFDAKMAEIAEVAEKIRETEAIERQPTPSPAPSSDPAAIRAEATRLERERQTGIRSAVRAAQLGDDFAQRLIDDGTALDAARTAVLAELETRQQQQPTRTQIAVQTGEDEADKRRRGIGSWLIQKAGVTDVVRAAAKKHPEHPAFAGLSFDAGEFRGLSLLDLCRMSLEQRGIKTAGLDKVTLVGRALTLRDISGAQTTSDFTVALENTLHKVLLAAYMVTPDTWRAFCAVGSVTDFRAHPRYRTGYLGKFDTVGESGEFKNKSIPDATKESITAGTKGNILSLSRQAIINDDMGVFNRVAMQLGRAAKLTVEIDVYDLLKLNSGLGPVMNDGNTLFHATHANISTGAALSAGALDLDRVAMASQTDPQGNEILDLRPAILLVPIGLGGAARVINQSQYDPDNLTSGSKATLRPNVVAGLFSQVVDTPRLSGTRRYLFADPALMPVIEVAFLEGQQEPFMDMQDGWRVDGVEWKARLDYGVAAIEVRGALTNAGA